MLTPAIGLQPGGLAGGSNRATRAAHARFSPHLTVPIPGHPAIPMRILPLSDLAQATRATMIGLLDSGSEALAGYPVAPLIRGCWRPRCAGVSVRGCALASNVLQVWIRQLDHDLQLLAPGAGTEMARIRRQIDQTRDALARLQDCVHALQGHPRATVPAAAAKPHGRPAAARTVPGLPPNTGRSLQQPGPAGQADASSKAMF